MDAPAILMDRVCEAANRLSLAEPSLLTWAVTTPPPELCRRLLAWQPQDIARMRRKVGPASSFLFVQLCDATALLRAGANLGQARAARPTCAHGAAMRAH